SEQSEALLRAATADEDPYCWLFVAFGLNTAMRHSEILRARFEHLDLDHAADHTRADGDSLQRTKDGSRSTWLDFSIAPALRWCRRRDSNPRPAHYEAAVA